MKEPSFHTSLTNEQIEENFKNTDIYSEIKEGLQQAIAYAKGEETGALVREVSVEEQNHT